MTYSIKCHEHIFTSEAYFPQCHASTIERLPNGNLISAWFAGSYEKAPDVAIWLSIRAGETWSAPKVVASYAGIPCWNPVLFYNDGKLTLYYKVGKEIHTWQTMFMESTDGGYTWTAEKELVTGDESGGRGPVRNKCLRLKNGTILAPASIEDDVNWDCFIDISTDSGRSWRRSNNIPRAKGAFSGKGIIQPTLWEDDDGIVHMLARSTEGSIFSSKSTDFGHTWDTATKTGLPNNNCGIDIARLQDGRLVLVYNPISGNWASRSHIAFTVSEDNGVTWSAPQTLDYTPCEPHINVEDAEFSYPAIIAHGNDIYITYTWKRRTIVFWQISLQTAKQKEHPIKDGAWVTMVTPFKEDGAVAYNALGSLIDWYIKNKVDGLFAVCQSSEMFYLSQEERAEIARFVMDKAAKRVPVIISGHVSDGIDAQISELRDMCKIGAAAVVLVSNRLANEDEDDLVWMKNAQIILDTFPDHIFGIYECPYPYKRLMSPELLKWCAETKRFAFLKDTCCDMKQLQAKLDAVQGTSLKIFNANTATFLESLRAGASGFCGVMANFHPELYVWLIKNGLSRRQKAEAAQSFATTAALIELQNYPANAKYHLKLRGVDMNTYVRKPAEKLTDLQKEEVLALLKSWQIFSRFVLD